MLVKAIQGSLVAVLAMATVAQAQVASPREVAQQRGHGAQERMVKSRAGYSVPRTVGADHRPTWTYDRVTPTRSNAPAYVRQSAPANRLRQQPVMAAPRSAPVEHRVARPIQPEPAAATPATSPNSAVPCPDQVPVR